MIRKIIIVLISIIKRLILLALIFPILYSFAVICIIAIAGWILFGNISLHIADALIVDIIKFLKKHLT